MFAGLKTTGSLFLQKTTRKGQMKQSAVFKNYFKIKSLHWCKVWRKLTLKKKEITCQRKWSVYNFPSYISKNDL